MLAPVESRIEGYFWLKDVMHHAPPGREGTGGRSNSINGLVTNAVSKLRPAAEKWARERNLSSETLIIKQKPGPRGAPGGIIVHARLFELCVQTALKIASNATLPEIDQEAMDALVAKAPEIESAPGPNSTSGDASRAGSDLHIGNRSSFIADDGDSVRQEPVLPRFLKIVCEEGSTEGQTLVDTSAPQDRQDEQRADAFGHISTTRQTRQADKMSRGHPKQSPDSTIQTIFDMSNFSVDPESGYVLITPLLSKFGYCFFGYSRHFGKTAIQVLEAEIGRPATKIRFGSGSWVHPRLVVDIASWIGGGTFRMQVSRWVELAKEHIPGVREEFARSINDLQAEDKSRQEEAEVRSRLASTLENARECVILAHGETDIVSDDEVIEVKHVTKYLHALGQVLGAKRCLPMVVMRVHLFGHSHEMTSARKKKAEQLLQSFGVRVTFEAISGDAEDVQEESGIDDDTYSERSLQPLFPVAPSQTPTPSMTLKDPQRMQSEVLDKKIAALRDLAVKGPPDVRARAINAIISM